MKKKIVLAFLLLCSTAVADGPLFSIWHIDGHGYAWQQAQLDAGLPVEPSLRMPSQFEGQPNNPSVISQLDAIAPVLSKMNGRQIVMRMNNMGQEIDWTIPRVSPLNEDTWRASHMCVRRLPTGALDATPIVSPFAGTAAWAETGRKFATTLWMTRLQQIVSTPTGVILRQNNEGGRITSQHLYVSDRPRMRTSKGTLAFAELITPSSLYLDSAGQSLTSDWIVYTGSDNKLYMERWRTDAELDTIDLRAKEWVAPRRTQRPSDSLADFTALERAQYQALYAAFDANSAPGWRGKLRTCGYGEYAENRQNDAASPAMYLGTYRDTDLTKPGAYAVNRWNAGAEEVANEAANPKAWREYSIALSATSVYAGAKKGSHAAVDPESYAGLMSHVAWRMQAPGREVRLVEWDNYNVKPTHLIFASTTNGTTINQVHVDALNSIGRPELLAATIQDYELAVLRALDRIHDHPMLSRYWRDGTTRLMASPLNTATATKVYATETSIPGVSAKLVCVYTPCDLTGLIQVEGLLLTAKRLGYYINGAAVEVQ